MANNLSDFRPQVWADTFLDLYNAQAGLLDLVSRYDTFAAGAKRGQTIQLPIVSVDAAAAITVGSDATLATLTDSGVTLTIDKFRGHLLQIDPLDDRFAHADARRAVLADVARVQKNDANSIILDLADDTTVDDQTVNSGGGALTDADILAAKKYLDDAEFPEEDRILVVTPDGENDLMGITTYISKDFGDGQGQNSVPMVRGFRVVKLPTARFNDAAGVKSCLAFHKSAIGAAVAAPHMRLVPRGGKFDSVLEVGSIWGLKVIKATGCVRVLR